MRTVESGRTSNLMRVMLYGQPNDGSAQQAEDFLMVWDILAIFFIVLL